MTSHSDDIPQVYEFTIEELKALTRLLEHDYISHKDEEAIAAIDKIFKYVEEYEQKNRREINSAGTV